MYGLGGERQRSGNETRFPLSHFSFTPHPMPDKQAHATYYYPQLSLHAAYITLSLSGTAIFLVASAGAPEQPNKHGSDPI